MLEEQVPPKAKTPAHTKTGSGRETAVEVGIGSLTCMSLFWKMEGRLMWSDFCVVSRKNRNMGVYVKSTFKMRDLSSYEQKAPFKSGTKHLQKCYWFIAFNFHFLKLPLYMQTVLIIDGTDLLNPYMALRIISPAQEKLFLLYMTQSFYFYTKC